MSFGIGKDAWHEYIALDATVQTAHTDETEDDIIKDIQWEMNADTSLSEEEEENEDMPTPTCTEVIQAAKVLERALMKRLEPNVALLHDIDNEVKKIILGKDISVNFFKKKK